MGSPEAPKWKPIVDVVEDDEETRDLIGDLVEYAAGDLGITPEIRKINTAAGLQAELKNEKVPDIMLIDFKLGTTQWDETLNMISEAQQDPKTAHVAFIGISAFPADSAVRQQAEGLGLAAIIEKPFALEQVITETQTVLRSVQERQQRSISHE